MMAWPTEITYQKSLRKMTIAFDNGEVFEYPAAYLRVESPSAETKGHGGQVPPKIPVEQKATVQITAIEPVGNYAVRLVFDDGHNTGLYSWAYLYELGQKNESCCEAKKHCACH